MVLTDQLCWQVFYFCGWVGGMGGVGVGMEKLRSKLTLAKVEVEVEAELGNLTHGTFLKI